MVIDFVRWQIMTKITKFISIIKEFNMLKWDNGKWIKVPNPVEKRVVEKRVSKRDLEQAIINLSKKIDHTEEQIKFDIMMNRCTCDDYKYLPWP